MKYARLLLKPKQKNKAAEIPLMETAPRRAKVSGISAALIASVDAWGVLGDAALTPFPSFPYLFSYAATRVKRFAGKMVNLPKIN
jgi:hypothetical protein